jgi:hypothetical protein
MFQAMDVSFAIPRGPAAGTLLICRVARRHCWAILARAGLMAGGCAGTGRREVVVFDGLVARMAERAVPAGIDPEQERIAMEAAATGIREAGWIVAIVGLIALLAGGAAVALYLPGRPAQPVPAQQVSRTEGLPESSAENPAEARGEGAREEEKDGLQARLDVAVKEREVLRGFVAEVQKDRDALRGKVADLERGTGKEREALQGTVAELQKERDALRGKVADLERRLASVSEKAPATPAAPEAPAPPGKVASPPVRAKAPAGPRGVYVCGDGRTVRDPANCKARPSSASPSAGFRPGTYLCGDGQAVRDPAACRSSASR